MNLAEKGLPTEESDATAVSERQPKSVSKRNEALLRNQSKALAEEYEQGVWAHPVPTPEVGGLVCRLPLEVEIWRARNKIAIGKKLRDALDFDTDARDEDDGTYSASSEISPMSAKTALWYRAAQQMVVAEFKKVTDTAVNGRVDPNRLPNDAMELLRIYLDHQETWQEVCLVISRDEHNGNSSTLVLNRPLSLRLSENLASMVLFGRIGKSDVHQTGILVKFLVAFENECAMYVGGPDMQHKPALMIHGIADLEGAEEISPGCGIYRGGLDAAISGVMTGKYKPLDFRFFVGRHNYKDFELETKVALGKYQPIASARCIALKQCIALPKPLWHEVLELCGGELKDISALEFAKRDDLLPEEEDK